ncbi:TetR/AcrR family transcriptional regulator [Mucilaginibacter achroorhodeus]|uniref:TetR/AcrR family transcriptional regulator n=1 Tax=Mucilaginibacter achroorhodeus TaxID=2599294 RepID=A0A563U608_9SPHI|nr:TetR/AcrR family transcriptional regulator [Mucilaginibacter achroorhodeus]TWR26749.1 TetR/AcrR family transcriptional regulator [Mucilaginibacter achroorhodeus]
MERKAIDGPQRNKARTKANILKATGKILKEDGFSKLNVARIADEAKTDRKLIYNYFGNLDGLVKEYLESHDYWKIQTEDIGDVIQANLHDSGKTLATEVLVDQLSSLLGNEEMRQIITWGLSQRSSHLKELDLKRETVGNEILAAVIDDRFKDGPVNFRALYALLMGGVYYLTLHAKMLENTFCGIDIQKRSGQEVIKKTIIDVIDLIYADMR